MGGVWVGRTGSVQRIVAVSMRKAQRPMGPGQPDRAGWDIASWDCELGLAPPAGGSRPCTESACSSGSQARVRALSKVGS